MGRKKPRKGTASTVQKRAASSDVDKLRRMVHAKRLPDRKPDTVSTVKISKPSLLSIPGEIRNKIYRLMLVTKIKIMITQASHRLPALVRTCRQMKREAESIYLCENNFGVLVHDFAFQMPTQQWVNQRYHSHKFADNITFHFTGQLVWANLLAWIKRHHTELILAVGKTDGRVLAGWDSDAILAIRAFAIAIAMRNSAWGLVEAVLSEYASALASLHPLWKWG